MIERFDRARIDSVCLGGPKRPELETVTDLRRIAGERQRGLKREFSRMDTHFGCRKDGCQTLFLILKHRSGLQRPVENTEAVEVRSHRSIPNPPGARADYETARAWNPPAVRFSGLHHG